MTERRAHKRIKYSAALRFFCGEHFHSLYYGTIKDISQNGIYINTMACFPYDSELELLICIQDDILQVPAKVRRILREDGFYCAMGLTIVDPSEKFLKFFNGIQ